jgi:hypothetical protein
MKCRAFTKKNCLCKKNCSKNSAYCSHHQQTGKYNKFKYTLPTEGYTDYYTLLPIEIHNIIFKNYFTNNVLVEINKYRTQGDFSKLYRHNFWIDHITRDYCLVRDNDLWDVFRRKHVHNYNFIMCGYTDDIGILNKFRNVFRFIHISETNIKILEYIAEHGWIKFVMQ